MTKLCWETVSKKVTVVYFNTVVLRTEDCNANFSPWLTRPAIRQWYSVQFAWYE